MTDTPEFSRMIDVRAIDARALDLVPSDAERAALAARFALVAVESLAARIDLTREGETVTAKGRLTAAIIQPCAVSGEDLPVAIDEPLFFRFIPEGDAHRPDEEVELTEQECDEIAYTGTRFDLGEAVAQSLGLAIDPFAVGPEAEVVRGSGLLGKEPDNVFAALKGWQGKPD